MEILNFEQLFVVHKMETPDPTSNDYSFKRHYKFTSMKGPIAIVFNVTRKWESGNVISRIECHVSCT